MLLIWSSTASPIKKWKHSCFQASGKESWIEWQQQRRGEKINTCANFFVRSVLFGCFCKQLAAVVVTSQGTGGMAVPVCYQRKHRDTNSFLDHTLFSIQHFYQPCSLSLLHSCQEKKKRIYWTLEVHFSRIKGLTKISFWATSGVISV